MKIEFKIITGDIIKQFLFLLFLLLPTGKGFSQKIFNNEVYHPSVNAEQFNIGASIETSLSKGQPSVVIPLFELQGKGYNLPISLMFYGGDVTSETEASNIGLGWSLMAGGCITATVKDKEDLEPWKNAPWQFEKKYLEKNLHSLTMIQDMNNDLMPDELQYSIPGHQGTLELVENKQSEFEWKLYPDETYKLKKDTINDSIYYTITADDGTKFIFKDVESKLSYNMNSATTVSSAYFLTRIETVKGDTIEFNYAKEAMLDPHDEGEDLKTYGCHHTKRITSIKSNFGSVTFTSGERKDKGECSHQSTPSERITKIELKDENDNVVRGYELNNDTCFETKKLNWDPNMDWSNYRLMLRSIVEYDALGNKLPPYVFTYDYKFGRAKTCYKETHDNNPEYNKRGSWTKDYPYQQLMNLNKQGQPACKEYRFYPSEGVSTAPHSSDGMTVTDYFCLKSVKYPTGALDTFEYERHDYSNIAGNDTEHTIYNSVAGNRLKRKVSYDGSGDTQAKTVTEYIYRKHNSTYEPDGVSSGVLTNPSFHYATRYTLGEVMNTGLGRGEKVEGLVANCISNDKPLNSYAGQPVYYKEVEEVIKNGNNSILRRNIHYFTDSLLEAPVNYVYVDYGLLTQNNWLVTIPNIIYGKRSDYDKSFEDFYSDDNYAYMAYPLGEFQQKTQDGGLPLKEVTLDGDGRLILKREFGYTETVKNTRYGYVYTVDTVNTSTRIYNISRTARHAERNHVSEIIETAYSYRGSLCDSIVTETSYEYNLGRPTRTTSCRLYESPDVITSVSLTTVTNFYPDMLNVGESSGTSSEVQAVAALQQKNIIAKPIQTVRYNKDGIAEGHYSDYKVLPGGQVVQNASYDLALNGKPYYNFIASPVLSKGSITKNSGFYLQEKALDYDASLNPCHVGSRVSPDKVIVWGYGGRYPVAVIENYTQQQLNANSQLRSLLSKLDEYRKIDSQTTISALKSLNMNIRKSLPNGVLLKTYTYDPYAGLTSEFDYSGVGAIYTYDGFGRLTKVLDHNGSVISTNSYNYKK